MTWISASPRLRRASLVVCATVVALATAVSTGLFAAERYLAAPFEGAGEDGRITFLFIGSDAGPPRPGSPLTDGRADGFHIVSLSKDRKKVNILSFPRDSYVPVAGQGTTKINSCLMNGPEAGVETAAALTSMEFDGYVLTTFKGFERGVNAMGGVEIDVEQRLSDSFSHSNLEPGVQVLDGQNALAYVRDRKSRPKGDLDRAESHARFLQATHAQLTSQGKSLGDVHRLMGILRATTVSNMSAGDMFRLADVALNIPPANVERLRIDSYADSAGSASIVRISDTGYAQIADIAEDGVIGPG
ncbi:MAG TPA: LCP family protein [Solirubrobacteraceae bacterium]|nr:LCP family protein [Solirubrobacteraceae bacterium]